MAFTLSGSVITQSGTDTSLAGLSGIGGVSVETSKYTRYTTLDRLLSINGSLSIPNVQTLRTTGLNGTGIIVNSGGTLTIGQPITTVRSTGNVTTYPQYTALELLRNTGTPYLDSDVGLRVLSGGTLVINGGNWISNQSIKFETGAIIRINGLEIRMISDINYNSIYLDAANMITDGLIVKNPNSAVAVFVGLRANYTQLKGYEPINCASSGTIDSVNIGGVSITDFTGGKSQLDFKFRTPSNSNMYLIFGSNIGNALIVGGSGSNEGQGQLKHFIRSNPRIVDINENPIAGAKIYLKDTNNGSRSTVYEVADRKYLTETLATGRGTLQNVLTALFHNGGNNSAAIFILDNRLPAVGSVLSYGHLISSISVTNSAIADQNGDTKILTDTNVTLSETNAVAKLASSFSVNSGTNTITVTANSTLDDLYDAMKAWKTRNVQAQLEYPTIATQPVNAGGTNLVTSMNIVGIEFLTTGTKFKTLQVNGTASGTISNLSIVGNVSQATPANLSNVQISGTLTYNTNVDTTITIINTTIGTVVNNGTGIITINKVNSTIDNYTDAEINFIDSTISVIGADTVTFHPTANDRDLNTNASGSFSGSSAFKFGSTINGSTMSGTLYLRCVAGGIPFNINKAIVIGDNLVDLGTTAQLASLSAKIDLAAKQESLAKMNEGLKKIALYKPYKTDL